MSTTLTMRKPSILVVLGKTEEGGWEVTNVRLEKILEERTDAALNESSKIKSVTDDKSLCAAIEARGLLTDAHGWIEGERKRVKAPFLAATKMIDAEPKRLTGPLEQEQTRLDGMIRRYEGEQRRMALARQAELERLSREMQAAAANTQDPERQEELAEASHELHLQARETEPRVLPGVSVQPTYEAVLIDFVKVANSNPHLLVQEVSKSAVNDMIRALSDGGRKLLSEDAIPGIRLVPTAIVRRR